MKESSQKLRKGMKYTIRLHALQAKASPSCTMKNSEDFNV